MKFKNTIKGILGVGLALCTFMTMGKMQAHAENYNDYTPIYRKTIQPGDTMKLNDDGISETLFIYNDGVGGPDLEFTVTHNTIEIETFADVAAANPSFTYPKGYTEENFTGWYVFSEVLGTGPHRALVVLHARWVEKELPSEKPSGQSSPAHTTHSYEWNAVKEPTAESDGLLAYQCTSCGNVSHTTAVSGMGAFVNQAIQKISKAEQSAALILNTKLWYSFPRSVYEAIAARPDVSVTINYRYQNVDYTVTIPAGADVLSLLDENGYCGFLKLNEVYGGREVK